MKIIVVRDTYHNNQAVYLDTSENREKIIKALASVNGEEHFDKSEVSSFLSGEDGFWEIQEDAYAIETEVVGDCDGKEIGWM